MTQSTKSPRFIRKNVLMTTQRGFFGNNFLNIYHNRLIYQAQSPTVQPGNRCSVSREKVKPPCASAQGVLAKASISTSNGIAPAKIKQAVAQIIPAKMLIVFCDSHKLSGASFLRSGQISSWFLVATGVNRVRSGTRKRTI